MEQFRQAVSSVAAELKKLQETLEARSSDPSGNLSAAKSHLARIKVWAVSVGLADPPRSEVTNNWSNVSLSIRTQVRSLLGDLVDLCREGQLSGRRSSGKRQLKTGPNTH